MALSPSGSPPQTRVGLDPESSICTTRHPGNVLTGIFTSLLQEHFANALNLEYNGLNEFADLAATRPRRQLQDYLWSRDNTQTRIQIQPVWKYNVQDIQRRPGLYVKRNAMRPQRLGINDGGWAAQSVHDAAGNLQEVRGRKHSVMVIGSHTVFAVGQSGAEAELLGQEVFNHLLMFAPILRSDMNFQRLNVMEMGEVAILEEYDDHMVVPVVVAYGFPWTWRIEQVAPKLKTIAIDAVAT